MPSKDLILSKLEEPSHRDFVGDALAAKKKRRKKLIIIGLLALLAAGWFVPVFSEQLPDGMWHEADFELVRPELEKAIDDVDLMMVMMFHVTPSQSEQDSIQCGVHCWGIDSAVLEVQVKDILT